MLASVCPNLVYYHPTSSPAGGQLEISKVFRQLRFGITLSTHPADIDNHRSRRLRIGLIQTVDRSYDLLPTYYFALANELHRSKLMGYQNIAMRIYPKGVTPNVLIGGPVPVSPGFLVEAFGNDRL
jgi:hypothetical protein